MQAEGGCYCKAIRYRIDGEPMFQAQCHCRECQYISGGGPNYFIGVPSEAFRYTQGSPASFTRTDLEAPVTREFCPTCGTSLTSRPPGFPGLVVKVGTLDDPTVFDPQMAIFTIDKQAFHHVPEGMATFERSPG